MLVSLQTGETIYDMAINQYGHISGIFNIIKDNGLSFSSQPIPGSQLLITENISLSDQELVAAYTNQEDLVLVPMVGQNLFDVSIQHYGSIEGSFLFILENGIQFSTLIEAGNDYKITNDVYNKQIVDYFKARPKPATGNELFVGSVPVLEGIGYWIIEDTFIVS